MIVQRPGTIVAAWAWSLLRWRSTVRQSRLGGRRLVTLPTQRCDVCRVSRYTRSWWVECALLLALKWQAQTIIYDNRQLMQNYFKNRPFHVKQYLSKYIVGFQTFQTDKHANISTFSLKQKYSLCYESLTPAPVSLRLATLLARVAGMWSCGYR